VIVETDGEAVTLATEVEPSLTYHEEYSPYNYGIMFDGESSSNTLNDNTIENNAGGVLFQDNSTSNTISNGSITSYNYNAVSDTTGTNTLDNVDFNRSKVNVISGTLIILPETEEITTPKSRNRSSGSSPAVIASFQVEQLARALATGTDPTPYLNGIQASPTTTPPTSSSATTWQSRTLKLTTPHMMGDDVKTLQTYLNTHGYDCGIADGVFGLKTKQVIINFQIANGLTPDGVVGPLTQAKLK